MNPIVTAILVLTLIGIACAVLLVLASKFMSVPVDERFPKIRECLPGANCGGCGYAGCDGYAEALVDGSEEKINKCIAGGNSVAEALASATGKAFEETEKKTAFVLCRGECSVTEKKVEFSGSKTCKSAKLIYGGDGACAYGCLGYGDCAAVCPEQAINIINGLAHINESRCMGCGMCEKTCPQKIIRVMPSEASPYAACSNKGKGAAVNKICSSGCIGCGLCAKKCPEGAITLTNNLPSIDTEKCIQCGACKEACPKKCIL